MPPVPAIRKRQAAAQRPGVFSGRGQTSAATWLSRLGAAIRAAVQPATGGRIITTSQQLMEELRVGYRTDAGVDVTPTTSMQVAAVYRCVSIIAGTMAMLPWRVFERDDRDGSETLAFDHPADQLLARAPNRWQTPYQFKHWLGVCQCLRGNAYVFVVRKRGEPVELVPLHPDHMTVEQIGDFDRRYIYTTWDGRRQMFDASEIMHFMPISLNGLWGLSPIDAARQGVGLAMAAEKFGARHFGSGVRPTGAMKLPAGMKLTEEQITRLRADINSVLAGVDNSHKVAVLEEGMEWQALSMTAEEAQYIEARKFQRSEIAMFFGVPPHMLGDVDKQTSWGTGIESQGIAFIIYTMLPWLVSGQDVANSRLFASGEPYFTKHITDDLTRADLATQATAAKNLVDGRIISPNEARRWFHLNPRDGGDEFAPLAAKTAATTQNPPQIAKEKTPPE